MVQILAQAADGALTTFESGLAVALAVLWIVAFPVACAMIAHRRGQSIFLGAVLGCFCGVFGLLIALLAFKKPQPAGPVPGSDPSEVGAPHRPFSRGGPAYSDDALNAARALAEHLAARGGLPSLRSPLRLTAGEAEHFVTRVRLWRYTTGDPTYVRTHVYGGQAAHLFWGALDDRNERRVRRDADPCWRVVDAGNLHVTNKRVILWNDTSQISTWPIDSIQVLRLDQVGVFAAWEGNSVVFDAGPSSPYLHTLMDHLWVNQQPAR